MSRIDFTPSVPGPTRPGSGLAGRLRTETRTVHERTEGSDFVTELMAGHLSRAEVALFARQLYAVYSALEDAADRLGHDPRFAPLDDPALRRVPSLLDDGAALGGTRWRDQPVLPATAAYADRLSEVGGQAPALVAHHYTRYLGDLSGGLALGRLLSRHLDVAPGEAGVRFYHFPGIPLIKTYRDTYRARLDALPLTASEQDDVVAEAVVAFGLNGALFADLLAADVPAADPRAIGNVREDRIA
jgi:heme oxygenase